MNKLRKFGLRISFATCALGIILWCAGLFGGTGAEDFGALAIYLIVSSVFFASPHMIITNKTRNDKNKLEVYADLAVSSFYTLALAFVLYNAIPYFKSGETASTLQTIGQLIFAASFFWTFCLHAWSTFSNLLQAFAPSES